MPTKYRFKSCRREALNCSCLYKWPLLSLQRSFDPYLHVYEANKSSRLLQEGNQVGNTKNLFWKHLTL